MREMCRKSILVLVLAMLAACSAKSVPIAAPAEPLPAVAAGGKDFADPREQELRSVLAEAEPLMRNLLLALGAGDYAGYSRDFDESLRAAVSEEQFGIFYEESYRKKLGPYEEGSFQVNKIEKYPDFYAIYYFVKFRNVEYQNPVRVSLRVVAAGGGLRISGISYNHQLLGP